jgi:hypothetical protein
VSLGSRTALRRRLAQVPAEGARPSDDLRPAVGSLGQGVEVGHDVAPPPHDLAVLEARRAAGHAGRRGFAELDPGAARRGPALGPPPSWTRASFRVGRRRSWLESGAHIGLGLRDACVVMDLGRRHAPGETLLFSRRRRCAGQGFRRGRSGSLRLRLERLGLRLRPTFGCVRVRAGGSRGQLRIRLSGRPGRSRLRRRDGRESVTRSRSSGPAPQRRGAASRGAVTAASSTPSAQDSRAERPGDPGQTGDSEPNQEDFEEKDDTRRSRDEEPRKFATFGIAICGCALCASRLRAGRRPGLARARLCGGGRLLRGLALRRIERILPPESARDPLLPLSPTRRSGEQNDKEGERQRREGSTSGRS